MRRAKPISVAVKAPTRGLVTRLPSLSADLMPTRSGMIQGTIFSAASIKRAAAVAQNVRYEDGVVCAAPGYIRISLSSELLQDIVAYWPLNEASGTRYDATPNYNNLTDVPGPAGIPDIFSDAGILGAAALFPGVPPGSPTEAESDSFSLDAAMSFGFINPRVARLPNDLWTLDAALNSGAYFSTLQIADAPDDSASMDAAIGSGAYVETVVAADSPSDSASLDAALGSGAYVLVIIVQDAPEDSASLDCALSGGTYIETIIGPYSAPADSASLDAALHGGAYS